MAQAHRACARSIPACAGEPRSAVGRRLAGRVYPRVCGGTDERRGPERLAPGLSPRVRGNQVDGDGPLEAEGSIPACAGEPSRSRNGGRRGRVYPRVCGGTTERARETVAASGLSPRVRGNRGGGGSPPAPGGSIPACAGEPAPRHGCSPPRRVYPRVCGGTRSWGAEHMADPGLSPRVRGNRLRPPRERPAAGSIPACAGEPAGQARYCLSPRVYPRVCGGTECAATKAPRASGLSPRVRGNRESVRHGRVEGGSIPACAGEPRTASPSAAGPRVYPRVCGGTAPRNPNSLHTQGLSPRVRGNRIRVQKMSIWVGSIPACAGEPAFRLDVGRLRGVYPRVCGGTAGGGDDGNPDPGLSPRVRGNL